MTAFLVSLTVRTADHELLLERNSQEMDSTEVLAIVATALTRFDKQEAAVMSLNVRLCKESGE